MVVDRIEVYLDGASEPLAVLKEPPYRLNLDTRKIPDGEHVLRVVTHFRGGGEEIREIPFTVNNYPDVMVLGLDEGGEVAGTLELRLAVGEPELPVEPVRFNPIWYVVASVIVLGSIWAYFALSPATERIVAEVAPPAQGTQTHGGQAAPAGNLDQALMEKGKSIYEANCAACHGANGQGIPPAFPALAGNANLKDAQMILNVVKNGRGAMPAVGAAFSDEDLKAVATYIRNSFGNSFGPVE
ncbi:c-type cytochrome [Thermus tengchongensis]|uniref:Cytochrome c n=1 Tax=Thermus tengchongensis TaxID=1214928 RepID=A0A4Y9EWG6_9DEIN|nr:c-type cytochrome [Thermus tengchongensis]TFU16476.1 cytochrome c [Thermus tengchongensis]TFU27704.1 cytochrome c [Thermus tengchongensis]